MDNRKKDKSKHKEVELKSFCTARETINRMKSQFIKWEKLFENHIFNKRLKSKIYKKPTQINSKKKNHK